MTRLARILLLALAACLALAAPASADFGLITAAGGPGDGDGQFRSPQRIASDASGNVYVADFYNDRVQVLAPDGSLLAKWGSRGSGDGQFDSITGIAVDPAGTVYVADTGARIQAFTAGGQFLGRITPAGVVSIVDLAAAPDGSLWIANDRGLDGERIDHVTSAGAPISSFEASDPRDVAVDGSGNVYFTNFSGEIEKHAPDGAKLAEWPAGGGFERPRGLGVDAAGGIVHVAGPGTRVQRFTLDGASLGAFDTVAAALDAAGGPSGSVWVSTGQVTSGDGRGDQLLRYGDGAPGGAPADFAAAPTAQATLEGAAPRFGHRYATIAWSVGCNADPALLRRGFEVDLRAPGGGEPYTPVGAESSTLARAEGTTEAGGSTRVILSPGVRLRPHVAGSCSSRRQPSGEPVRVEGAADGNVITVPPALRLGRIQYSRSRRGRLLGTGQAPRANPRRLRRGRELRVFLGPQFHESLAGRGFRRVVFRASGAGVRLTERLRRFQFEDAGPRILVKPRKRGTLRIWVEVAGVRSSNTVRLRIR